MKSIFEEYADTLLSIVISLIIISSFVSIFLTMTLHSSSRILAKETIQKISYSNNATIGIRTFEVKDILVYKNEDFNFYERITATNNRGDFGGEDEDIRSFVHIFNNVDTTTLGEKEIIYCLSYNDETIFKKASVIVVDDKE